MGANIAKKRNEAKEVNLLIGRQSGFFRVIEIGEKLGTLNKKKGILLIHQLSNMSMKNWTIQSKQIASMHSNFKEVNN